MNTPHDPRIRIPMLVILLGSTPVYAGLELKQQLLALAEDDRRRVAVVYLHSDSGAAAEASAFKARFPGIFREYDLRVTVPAGLPYIAPEGPPSQANRWHTLIPGFLPSFHDAGCRGLRTCGHVAAAFNRQEIEQVIHSALSELQLTASHPSQRDAHEVRVVIVAFLGGGLGSGVLPDVVAMIPSIVGQKQSAHLVRLLCMVPMRPGYISHAEMEWRESNTMACLLELLALNLVAHAGPYTHYLLDHPYTIRTDSLPGEITLAGSDTTDESPTGIARAVGLDLFHRITEGFGDERSEYLHGGHGLTLGFLRAFHRGHAAIMRSYLDVQRRWLGPDWPSSARSYGQSGMPLHISGEMERLVWDPTALSFGRPLPDMVSQGTGQQDPSTPEAPYGQ